MSKRRLTEAEVHSACIDIASQGEHPTALNLLNKLGRGSLTTITKYLNSWNETDEAHILEAESLPAIVQLPDELAIEGEELTKKIWNIAKKMADSELEIQKDALKLSEITNQARVEEAIKFSEAQSSKIEQLDDALEKNNNQLNTAQLLQKQAENSLNEAEKTNISLTKDNESLKHEISELNKQIAALERYKNSSDQKFQNQLKEYTEILKEKDSEIRSLDIEKHQLKVSLDSSNTINNNLTKDFKKQSFDISDFRVKLKEANVRYETTAKELVSTKNELENANKKTTNAEKLVAKLEGKLEAFSSLSKRT